MPLGRAVWVNKPKMATFYKLKQNQYLSNIDFVDRVLALSYRQIEINGKKSLDICHRPYLSESVNRAQLEINQEILLIRIWT